MNLIDWYNSELTVVVVDIVVMIFIFCFSFDKEMTVFYLAFLSRFLALTRAE